jgi:hypothetical protein
VKRLIFIAALCAFAAAPALADLTVQYSGVNPHLGVEITSTGIDGDVVAGQYKIDIQGDTGNIIGAPGVVKVFCIDLWDWDPEYPQKYVLKPLDQAPDVGAGPMGEKRAGYLATLLNTYWDQADWSSAGSRRVNGHTYTQAEMAAAVQVAVWEIVDEFNTNTNGLEDPTAIVPTSWDVSGGLFYISHNETVANLANALLSNIGTLGPSDFGNYQAVSNHTNCSYYQDYVVRVPVPAALLLGLLGLGAAGLKLRKFA